MSASADATMKAIERALDRVGITDPDQREAFADKFYRGAVSEFEEAAVRLEFEKVARADIGRADIEARAIAKCIHCGVEIAIFAHDRRVKMNIPQTEGPVNADGFGGDAYDPA